MLKTILWLLALCGLAFMSLQANAGKLPQPITCLFIHEFEAKSGGKPVKHFEFSNTCATEILLHVVFEDRDSRNITRFPGYFAPKSQRKYGTIIKPGEKTLYDAYGPYYGYDINAWVGAWGACAEYHPVSINEAAGYATCKESNKPPNYWKCPDGTPFPPTKEELYEVTEDIFGKRHSRGSPRERAGDFCYYRR